MAVAGLAVIAQFSSRSARKSRHFVGYEGLTLIAASGLDMKAWDALANAADRPLCIVFGGSVGPVNANSSSGLWRFECTTVAAEYRAMTSRLLMQSTKRSPIRSG
ncbi:MAG: hypothetical protein WAK01_07485 [Methylocystis sp.]